MSKKVEVYSDGSEPGNAVVELVRKHACPKCEIVVRNVEKGNLLTMTVWLDGKKVDLDKVTNKRIKPHKADGLEVKF
ncbi:hypothetical protein RJP21_16405 [Paenibacillus sp. VCA1]|uniref:hypothetical protein n=1 Tax=Paenibacillus sp. VCA1 TaxID=3039148 RepID=UPI00287178EF|nr:hypothetical protein [Paenibacillus sp. VCA1]MDR9855201.1 hypothetical protein [Paenibacillus sp. VCA1]